jgi:Family of unknown function (DUF6455)
LHGVNEIFELTGSAMVKHRAMGWPMFRNVERQATRMHDMMDKLDVKGIDVARVRSGEAYAEARTKCLDCHNTQECAAWLQSDRPDRGKPDFCPNLPLFDGRKKP